MRYLLVILGLALTGGTAMADDAFGMIVQDTFKIASRGTVITGKIDSGAIKVGDSVCLSSGLGPLLVQGIESFRKILDEAQAGTNVGILVDAQEQGAVGKGDRMTVCD
jgi:elongation factor Tu